VGFAGYGVSIVMFVVALRHLGRGAHRCLPFLGAANFYAAHYFTLTSTTSIIPPNAIVLRVFKGCAHRLRSGGAVV
jgi:hypothetical protein